MPISVYRGSLDQDALTTLGSPGYIAFFSDLKKDGSGQLWCPDCRGSVSAIESVFGGASSPQAHYVYADYASWKETRPGKLHKFKTEFDVQCVPTIIRFEQVSIKVLFQPYHLPLSFTACPTRPDTLHTRRRAEKSLAWPTSPTAQASTVSKKFTA